MLNFLNKIIKNNTKEEIEAKKQIDIKAKLNKKIKDKIKVNDKNKLKQAKSDEKNIRNQNARNITQLQIKWKYLMAQTDNFNKFKKSFGLNNIVCTDYGFSFRIYAPTAMYLDELEKLKPYIETEFACEFTYRLKYTEKNENAYADAKIIHPNKVKCNEIPFTPYDVKPYEVYLGVNVAGESIVKDVNVYSHILIAGQTRSGKNGCLDHILTSWIHCCSEKEIQIYLFQCAKRDLKKYQNCKQVYGYTEELSEMYIMLKHILEDMKVRSDILEPMMLKWKGDNIFDYNNTHKSNKLPYVYVVIDEFLALTVENSDIKDIKQLKLAIQSQLRAIGQHGGSVGINYVISHQKPEKELCPTFLKNMSNIRICFGFSDSVCSQIVLGNDLATGLPHRKAIVYDGEEFIPIYTTNLRGRIENNIKPSILNGHRTIFEDLRKQGIKMENPFEDIKKKRNNTPKQPDDFKRDISYEEELKQQLEDILAKEKEIALKEKQLQKQSQPIANQEVITQNQKRNEQRRPTFHPIEYDKLKIYKIIDNTSIDEKEFNKIVKNNISQIKGYVPYVPNKSIGKEKI